MGKLWERVVEARLRAEVNICKQKYDFIIRKGTTGAGFFFRVAERKVQRMSKGDRSL